MDHSAESDVAPHIVQQIVNAWDCCGTCAGGVLARYVASLRCECCQGRCTCGGKRVIPPGKGN